MSQYPPTVLIIPAYNEQDSIGKVLDAIPLWVTHTIVVNNNSTDRTAEVADAHGAIVVHEPQPGYGHACLAGIERARDFGPTWIGFIDGDYSDYPEELDLLVRPMHEGTAQFVIGSRDARFRESGSMTLPQIFGNWLATTLMRMLFGSRFRDLGPFRVMTWDVLESLEMEDTTYGWTVEMQLKVLRKKIPYAQVPVHYRNRIGISKISGTVKGAIFAGVKILGWIFKYGLSK